ncbi:multinuclear nonheme iron-dependent oxidase [Candidatus Nitrospira bockiana]
MPSRSSTVEQEFHRRLSRIPALGLGLSVDVYTPDLLELARELEAHRIPYGYLEVFKASQAALRQVRNRLHGPLAYHAEGLWLTQPHWERDYPVESEIQEAAEQLAILGSPWLNHECAAKQMAGYAFGTYLPPLFTRESADVAAMNASRLQRRLDETDCVGAGGAPLVLLEIPPLTYFGLGDISVAAFFRRLIERTPCGLVLDLGHIWTHYRYSGAWRYQSSDAFLSEFLDAFPLERVVQVHVAGLAEQDREGDVASAAGCPLPWWIDTHSAPIPGALWSMLAQVLAHPNLSALRGVALEVDTKSIALIAAELEHALASFGPWIEEVERASVASGAAPVAEHEPVTRVDEASLVSLDEHYAMFARCAAGRIERVPPALPSAWLDLEGLERYRRAYLPQEILTWGGDVREMFPETCRHLERQGVPVSSFAAFWFRTPRRADSGYDFFLLKLERFTEFAIEAHPAVKDIVEREAEYLRDGYRVASEAVTEDVGR